MEFIPTSSVEVRRSEGDDHDPKNRDVSGNTQPSRHITTACNPCRRKRRKCTGGPLCDMCRNSGEYCTYTQTDRRRQRPTKSETDTLLVQRNVLESLIEAIRDGREAFLVNQIRQGASVEDLADAITKQRDERVPLSSSISRLDGNLDLTQTPTNVYNANQNSQHLRKPEALVNDEPELVDEPMQQTGSLSVDAIIISRGPQTAGGTDDDGQEVVSNQRTSDTAIAANIGVRRTTHSRSAKGTSRNQLQWHCPSPQQGGLGYAVPGYTRTFGNLPMSSSVKANGYPDNIQARQLLNFATAEHLIFPLIDADDSPLGRVYTDFQQLGQRLISEGTPPAQVADQGPTDVTLFFRDRLPEDPMNASTWASEMLKSYRGTLADVLLLACAVSVGNLMRWLLMPTPQNYASIPPTMRPTYLQRVKPHPAWVDLMMFPTFRDALINKLRDWVGPCIRARWEILWPYSLEDALIRDTYSGRTYLAPEFVRYAVNPGNWLMQRCILEDFAEVEGSEMSIASE